MTYYSLFSPGGNEAEFARVRKDLLSDSFVWARDLTAQHAGYHEWLVRRGTSGEIYLFNSFSEFLFRSINAIHPSGGGFFSRLCISAHFGAMRVAFIMIACWRLWLIVGIIAFYFGWNRWKAYDGPDMLGQTGNGRLFYSGIRAGLDSVNALGAPELQVRGLACPQSVSEAEIKGSALGQYLMKAGIANQTNLALAGIILHHSNWPAYIANADEDTLLENCFMGADLDENCLAVLERIIDLHQFYRDGQSNEDFLDFLLHYEEQLADGEQINHFQYSRMLQQSLHRVLTPQMREDIAQIPAEQIATIVLAYEAGKTMAYAYEGGRWLRRSNHSELAARSVMHSVASYAQEYDFQARTNIRCAIIYGPRNSAFGPVKTPLGLSPQSRAARQWVELLMACPYELETAANEVEMHAIIREAHGQWVRMLFDGVMMSDPAVVEGIYATPGNLFLMPADKVIKLARRSMPPHLLARLKDLIVQVTQNQRLQTAAEYDGEGQTGIPAYVRIFNPLSQEEIASLAARYSLSAQDLHDWSALRVVLNSFGWLGRRVGDYSVPENSIIYAVLKVTPDTPNANHLGLIGVPGMVPLRATRFDEKWGRTWQSRFSLVMAATMAETREDYEKLMKGITDTDLDELGGASAGIA